MKQPRRRPRRQRRGEARFSRYDHHALKWARSDASLDLVRECPHFRSRYTPSATASCAAAPRRYAGIRVAAPRNDTINRGPNQHKGAPHCSAGDAMPYFAFLIFNAFKSVTKILVPDAPIGWPRDTAPP